MTKPKTPTLDKQEQAALADLWARVVLADDQHDDDREAARRKLSAPVITDAMLQAVDLWRLAALQAILDDQNPLCARIRELVGPL